jgi:hypothetical protein
MMRSFILAIGITLIIFGAECLVLDKVVLADSGRRSRSATEIEYDLSSPKRVFVPPEWSPWALLAAGSVIVLYNHSHRGGE